MTIASKGTARGGLFIFLFPALVLMTWLPSATAQVAPRYEVFGGYSYLRFDSPTLGYADYSNLNGWNAAATYNLRPQWGFTVDGSGHYGSQLNSYHYFFGPQYAIRRDKSKFFFHALFGKAQNDVSIYVPPRSVVKGVGLSVGGGGGFDWNYRPRITIRAVQVDYFHSNTFATSQNDVRVSAGVVINIGHIGHRPKL